MNYYEKTKFDYDSGAEWHIKKSLSYNWSKQIDKFIDGLHGNKVLDAGCGGARDISEFLKKGMNVDGIDYSGETIKKNKDKFPHINFYEGDIRKMNLPDDHYDGLWSCASLLNIAKDEVLETLIEFKRVLKKDGRLFISVKEGKGEKIITDQAGERLFSFFSVNELKKLVQQAGFRVNFLDVVSDMDLTGKVSEPENPSWICLYAINS